MRDAPPRRALTPPQVAIRLAISADKVLGWIRSGELRAVNVATRRGGRPRWRIAVEDLAEFKQARVAIAAQPAAPRRRRKESGVIAYY